MDDLAVKAIPEIIRENTKPEVLTSQSGTEFVLATDEFRIVSLKGIRDENRLTPLYRKENLNTHCLSSFIDHIKRYVSDDTILLAQQPAVNGNQASFKMLAIIDGHPKGTDLENTGAEQHKVKYIAALHQRAERWLDNERKSMKQSDFAAFIEDNMSDLCVLEDFVPPFGKAVASPADLLTLSRGLDVRVNQTVRSATRLSSGEVSLVFTTENTRQDGSELIVPEWFGLRLPIFVGTQPIIIPVRLRYAVREGVISFSFLFHNFEAVLEQIIRVSIDTVKEALPELHVVEGVTNERF